MKKSILEKFIPVLLVLIIVLAFGVGVLWQKVQGLEKGGTGSTKTPAPTASPLSVDNIKKYAKELGLNTNDFNSCLDNGTEASIVTADSSLGEANGVTGTPAFFINGRFLGGAYPFSAFQEIIDKELAGKGSSNYKNYSQTLQDAYTNGKSFDPTPKQIDLGNSPVLGDANAKVTIVEFSDFQCPFCERFFSGTFPEIKSQYIDKGLVKLVYKEFPLISIHPYAQKLAEASLCAAKQGKFWEMHDKLFAASALQ